MASMKVVIEGKLYQEISGNSEAVWKRLRELFPDRFVPTVPFPLRIGLPGDKRYRVGVSNGAGMNNSMLLDTTSLQHGQASISVVEESWVEEKEEMLEQEGSR